MNKAACMGTRTTSQLLLLTDAMALVPVVRAKTNVTGHPTDAIDAFAVSVTVTVTIIDCHVCDAIAWPE